MKKRFDASILTDQRQSYPSFSRLNKISSNILLTDIFQHGDKKNCSYCLLSKYRRNDRVVNNHVNSIPDTNEETTVYQKYRISIELSKLLI